MFELGTLTTGVLIFLARICDVSLGTVRTIVTVQGRGAIAFFLAIFEILIWIAVVSTAVQKISDHPILAIFYALGFATGNMVGIAVERKIALGFMVLRVFTRTGGKTMAVGIVVVPGARRPCGKRAVTDLAGPANNVATSLAKPRDGGLICAPLPAAWLAWHASRCSTRKAARQDN